MHVMTHMESHNNNEICSTMYIWCIQHAAIILDCIILQFQAVSREFVLLSLGPGFSASYPSSVETIMSLTTPTTNTIVCMLSPGDDMTDKGGQLAIVKCCSLSYNNSYHILLKVILLVWKILINQLFIYYLYEVQFFRVLPFNRRMACLRD